MNLTIPPFSCDYCKTEYNSDAPSYCVNCGASLAVPQNRAVRQTLLVGTLFAVLLTRGVQ